MPPFSKSRKLTAQPVRTRHFVGKPAAAEIEEPSSAEDSESEEEIKPTPFTNPKPAPLASSFAKSAQKANFTAQKKSEAERKQIEEEFETESEGEDVGANSDRQSEGGSSSSDEESDEEEESSSEEDAPKLLRPVFVKKSDRNKGSAPTKTAEEIAEEEEKRRQEQARALIQEQIEQRAAERLVGKRDWDDDIEDSDINAVDDTDGVNPEAEYAAWKLRELKRIKRERTAIEEAEVERAEIERRRNLSDADREAEDRAFIDKQKEERGDRGQMQFMQKYFHKGAFFQEELKELGVDKRNLMGAKFEDATNRETLPEYMQMRDLSKLGKKGGTRYKDMKSEDTGRWGDFGDPGRPRDKNGYGLDDRFRSDSGYRGDDRDREGPSGANAKPLGERKRYGEESSRESKRPRVDDRD